MTHEIKCPHCQETIRIYRLASGEVVTDEQIEAWRRAARELNEGLPPEEAKRLQDAIAADEEAKQEPVTRSRALIAKPKDQRPIWEARIRKGWTLRDLEAECKAEGADISYSQLCRIEKGMWVPHPRARMVLARVLELDLSVFAS